MARAAYHNDPAVKATAVERAEEHRHLGRFVQGQYGEIIRQDAGTEEFKGCALGCLAMATKFAKVPSALRYDDFRDSFEPTAVYERVTRAFNFSPELAELIDHVFECSAPAAAKHWPSEIVNAIPVGADVSGRRVREIVAGSDAIGEVVADAVGTFDSNPRSLSFAVNESACENYNRTGRGRAIIAARARRELCEAFSEEVNA